MKSDVVGFGLVGLGIISRAHLTGFSNARGHARLVAVCDRDRALAERVAGETGATAYTDYRDLLADSRVEAVDLPLPHNLHFEVASSALEAGKHVLVEKPMAPTYDECTSLMALAKTRGLKLSVAENTPFVAAYVALKRLLDEGTLGEPRLVRTLIYGSEVSRLIDVSNWKGRISGTVGGAIFDAGPHSFYLLEWLFGRIAEVQAVTNKLVEVSEVEDNAVVAGRLDSGAIFTTEFTFTAEIPWGERLEVYGSQGSAIIDQLCNLPAVYYRGKNDITGQAITDVAGVPIAHDPKGWKFKSIAGGVAGFARALATDTPVLVDPVDAASAIRVVQHAYQSAQSGGQRVSVAA